MVAVTSLGSSGKGGSSVNVKRGMWLETSGICVLAVPAALPSRKAGNSCTLEARKLLLITLQKGRETDSPYLGLGHHTCRTAAGKLEGEE